MSHSNPSVEILLKETLGIRWLEIPPAEDKALERTREPDLALCRASADGAPSASIEIEKKDLAEAATVKRLFVFSPTMRTSEELTLMKKIFSAMDLEPPLLCEEISSLPEESRTQGWGVVFGERDWAQLNPDSSYALAFGTVQYMGGVNWLVTHDLKQMLPPVLERTILGAKRQTWSHFKALRKKTEPQSKKST